MNLELFEDIAIHLSNKEQCINIIKLLNKLDNREWMEAERNNLLNADDYYYKNQYYGIYRNVFMSSSEASIFGYCIKSYEWFMNKFSSE